MVEERAAERDFVLRTARENDVKFIRLWFTDILGNLKGFAITVDDLEDAIQQGVGFDGAAIEGFARIDESDMRAFPDPTTFRHPSLASSAERGGPNVLRYPHSQGRALHR